MQCSQILPAIVVVAAEHHNFLIAVHLQLYSLLKPRETFNDELLSSQAVQKWGLDIRVGDIKGINMETVYSLVNKLFEGGKYLDIVIHHLEDVEVAAGESYDNMFLFGGA